MVKALCICQICTCGRHHCAHRPIRPSTAAPRCLLTEYKETYRNFKPEKRTKYQPNYGPKVASGPFDSRTNYKIDYIPHDCKPPPKKEKERYVRPEGTMQGNSTYQRDYFGPHIPPASSAKPLQTYIAHDTPFDDSTVHKDTYKKWDINFIPFSKPIECFQQPTQRMDGKTTFQTDYPGHFGIHGRGAVKPPEASLEIPKAPFEKDTTTRLEYTEKNVVPRTPAKPVERPPTSRPFDSLTTFRRDYPWHTPGMRHMVRPQQELSQHKVPFEGDTSYGQSYKKWDIPSRLAKSKSDYRPPSASMDCSTTFRQDYRDHGQPLPAKSCKPVVFLEDNPNPFDDTTTHNVTYRPWDVKPSLGKQMPVYRPSSARFQGESTFKSHYQGHFAPPAKSTKPDVDRPVALGDMDLQTSYLNDYTGHRPKSCPAKPLGGIERPRSSKKYIYSHDQKGHQYYKSLTESLQELSLAA